MKKKLLTIGFTLLMTMFTRITFAQTITGSNSIPKYVSDNGYWVVESNIHTPKTNTIYFYNNDNVMVYKEKLDGVRLKTKKIAVKMKLKKVLEQSIVAYNQKQKAAENEMLVLNLFK